VRGAEHDAEPYSGAIVNGASYKLDGECVWGRRMRAEGQSGGDGGDKSSARAKLALLTDLYFVVSTAEKPAT
jgi:hypothetical protein